MIINAQIWVSILSDEFELVAYQLLLQKIKPIEEWPVKRDLPSEKKSEITYEILAYLVDHPDSGDTLEGIAEWWLLERKIKYQVRSVKEALAELVTKGLVLEYKGRNAHTYYRLNRRKHKEIQALLKQ